MTLFPSIHGTPSTTVVHDIETPLGTIQSRIVIDSNAVTDGPPNMCLSLQNNGWYQQWSVSTGAVAQVCCRPAMLRAYWEQIHDCWGILWRSHFTHPVARVICEAIWMPNVSSYEGGPDSGQGLEAQTWHTPTVIVSLGTEGEDVLYTRAQGNDRLPRRLLDQAVLDWEILPLVKYTEQGVAITFTDVQADEEIQVHFAVAWATYLPDSIATWNAVNLSAQQILSGAMGARFDRSVP